MNILNKFLYYYSKAILHFQISSLRDCELSSNVKICPRCNLIRVKIGRYSYMSVYNTISDTSIGSFCSIGSYCTIGGGVHPLNHVSSSPLFYDKHNIFNTEEFSSEATILKQPQTIIGNDVWVGDMAFIKAGVTVGDGAVIGAHSVVTKDVPPYAIVGGVPAKVIKYRFSSEVVEQLMQLDYGKLTDELIHEHEKELYTPIDQKSPEEIEQLLSWFPKKETC